jgi:signal transduction histidine kinase
MRRWWSDTLFKRLFVLMWVALVASHLLGYFAAHRAEPPGANGPGLPPMPSLPPLDMSGPPHDQPRPPGPPRPGGPPPPPLIWLDYTVRALAIALAAAWGARWLSAPIRRLSDAAQAMGDALHRGRPPPRLDEGRGTVEVRQAAEVFNAMSTRLQDQFAAQQLLMASISHDLRTPLARLRLRIEQLGGHPQADRCVADIQEMDTLIDGALSLLREQHGAARPERVDLAALLQALTDDLVEQGHPVTLQAEPALVDAHPAALRRVLANLIGNALGHAGSAAVRLVGDGDGVQVTVDDRGPGIPADRLGEVFQPFYRIDPTSPGGAPRGAGLGLHIARDLARRDGGTVQLANRPEGGLRATLRLPRAPVSIVSAATQTSETPDTGARHTGNL